MHSRPRFYLAAVLISALALAACATDGEPSDPALDDEDSTVVESDVAGTAAAPLFGLFVQCACDGPFTHCWGEISNPPPVLSLKFNGVPVTLHGPSFSFNPGGSGNLVARGCKAGECSTRSRFIHFLQCPIGGGGGGGPAEP